MQHQLKRDVSRGSQIGCTLVLAIILGALGPFLLFLPSQKEVGSRMVFYIVGAGFSLAAILLVYSFFHQTLALRWQITIVSIDGPHLVRGRRARVHFEQRGPMELESLRASLTGSQWVTTGPGKRETRDLGTTNFLDSGHALIDDALPLRREAVLLVPENAPPTDSDTTWKIEVWGVVKNGADFHHKYPVTIV